jgi:hypothetical protein
MKIAYRNWNPRGDALQIVAHADSICESYAAQGYSLTLRQLYYQFVARGLIRNKDTEYKRLGGIIDDARMAGLIDWDHIVDRTRTLRELPAWGSPRQPGADSARDFIEAVMPQFRTPKWQTQPTRIEAWIEKDALIDVIARPANALQIPYFASRGYNSQSNAWRAAQRIESYYDEGADRVVILHLGDHDPEGIDMTRDIEARFRLFLSGDGYYQGARTAETEAGEPAFEIKRIALNMEQVERYNPPPNPAKPTSSRYARYTANYGTTCWELDALDPPTIDALVRDFVAVERDGPLWAEAVEAENEGRNLLTSAARRWDEVAELLDTSDNAGGPA